MNNKIPLFITEKPQGILIHIFVQPRSAKNAIAGPYKNDLKIKITAPPVGGAANQMCINFLAKCLKVPKTSIEIISGHTGRSKTILIHLPDRQSNITQRRSIIEFLSSFTK